MTDETPSLQHRATMPAMGASRDSAFVPPPPAMGRQTMQVPPAQAGRMSQQFPPTTSASLFAAQQAQAQEQPPLLNAQTNAHNQALAAQLMAQQLANAQNPGQAVSNLNLTAAQQRLTTGAMPSGGLGMAGATPPPNAAMTTMAPQRISLTAGSAPVPMQGAQAGITPAMMGAMNPGVSVDRMSMLASVDAQNSQWIPGVARPSMVKPANPPVTTNNISYGPSYSMTYNKRSSADKSAVKYTGYLPLEGFHEEDTCRIG